MNDIPRQKLREIIASYGTQVLDEPRRVEGLLRDICGEYKGEINALVSALRERVPNDMLAASASAIPIEVRLAQLNKRLQDDANMSQDAARWTVDSWALALGVIAVPSSSATTPTRMPIPAALPVPAPSSFAAQPKMGRSWWTAAVSTTLALVLLVVLAVVLLNGNRQNALSIQATPTSVVALLLTDTPALTTNTALQPPIDLSAPSTNIPLLLPTSTPIPPPVDTPLPPPTDTSVPPDAGMQALPTATYPMGDSNTGATTTIKLWIMPNTGNPKDDMIATLAGFKQLYPNINVQVTVLDWGSAFTEITNAVASGEGPDVTQLGTTWVGAVSALGGLRPYTNDEVNSMGGQPSFFHAAWNTSHQFNTTDITAIPWFLDIRALYYRTDILKNLNIDPTTGLDTWDHFDATMAKVKAANVVTTTYAFPGKNDWNVVHNFAPWVWSAGGDMLTPDNSASAFNSDQTLAGVKEYTSFVGKGYIPVSVLGMNTADVENIFKSGGAAFVVDGPWIVSESHLTSAMGGFSDMAAAGKVGVVPIPAGPAGSVTFVGGSDLSVMKSSTHPTEAVALIKYLTGQQANVAYAKLSGNMPASKAGYGDPYFSSDPMYQVFIKAAGTGKSYPTIAAWGQIEYAMQKNLSGLWDDVAGLNGTFSPSMIKPRLDSAAQEVNDFLAANK